ncbi:AAA family ATPase [Streptomyces profundus]|uniref:AAA family ATPase n=1 Tax=Streptomyces profundus TaxID=2867410 RepID=UPI001D16AE63|nr:AAA family ATPase [Streptomyces sp. MA3_2.13]UED85297.1 AAA family ATPase [Streptomyces sp. MA3_2.13]
MIDITPGELIVLVGPSAAGKSTFASQYPPTWRVCLDVFRGLVADDETDQSATPPAAEIQNLLLDARMARGLTSIVDSTNLMGHVRRGLLARARYYRCPAVAVLFHVPLKDCRTRNAARTRQVPADVLTHQHTLIPTANQLATEGFERVHSHALTSV